MRVGHQHRINQLLSLLDDLRMKLEGPMTTTGQEWYATHPNDPLGMKDILTVPDDIDYKRLSKKYLNL